MPKQNTNLFFKNRTIRCTDSPIPKSLIYYNYNSISPLNTSVPRQTLFVELFHERIGIESLYVINARFFHLPARETSWPDQQERPWYSSHPVLRFEIGSMMAAIIIHIISKFLSIFFNTPNATTDRAPPVIFAMRSPGLGKTAF